MREAGATGNDLFDRLAADSRLGLSRAEIDAADRRPGRRSSGSPPAQVRAVADRVAAILALHPDAGAYVPAAIL